MLLMESLKVNIADGTNAYNRHKFFFIEGEGWSVACGMCIFSAGTLVEVIIDMDTNTLTVDSSNFYTHRKSCCGGKASLVSFQERITAAQESLNRFFPCPKSAHKIENEPVDLSTEKERVTKLRFAMQCGVQGCGKLVTLFRLDKNQCWGCPFKIVLSNGIKHLEWHRNHTDPLSKTARDVSSMFFLVLVVFVTRSVYFFHTFMYFPVMNYFSVATTVISMTAREHARRSRRTRCCMWRAAREGP